MSTGHKYWYTLVLNMCPTPTLKSVASNPPRGLLQAQRIPRFPDNQHMKVERLSALRTDCFTPQEIFLVLVSVRDNDTIGNRTRHLPVCSAVPQPTAPPRALLKTYQSCKTSSLYMTNLKQAYSESVLKSKLIAQRNWNNRQIYGQTRIRRHEGEWIFYVVINECCSNLGV